LFRIIEKGFNDDKLSVLYDAFMLIVIIISLIPLFFKEETRVFYVIDKVTVSIFIVDYLFRWVTADYKFEQKGIIPFLSYPFTFMAIIDLLSILPSLTIINRGFKALRVLRMIRAFKVIRVFKVARYSKNIQIITNVLKKSKEPLIAVGVLATGYILVSALIIYNVEPNTFDTYFDAVYWATVSLTTVGYGDIYPVSLMGRIITMISSIFGIAIVALPAGIITAGYMSEIKYNIDIEEIYEEVTKNEEERD